MKKFQFSLDTVLAYKRQVQDVLQGEHAEVLSQVRQQEALLDSLWTQYRNCSAEYSERCGVGLSMTEVLIYQSELRAMEKEIQSETERLEQLREQEERKRAEVVEAKKETSSIKKLREKKQQEYQKALEKSEEAFVEEFVSAERVRASLSS